MSHGILIEKINECDLESALLESEFGRSGFSSGIGSFSVRLATYLTVDGADDTKVDWLCRELAEDKAVRISDAIPQENNKETVVLACHNDAATQYADTVIKLLLIKYPTLSGSLKVNEYRVFTVDGDAPVYTASALTDYLLYTGEYRLLVENELAGEGESDDAAAPSKRTAKSLAPKENAQLSEPFMTTQAAKIMDRYVRTVEEMEKFVALTTRSGATTEYSTTDFSQIEDILARLGINMGKDEAVATQNYFLSQSREPTEMELLIINRYRSERWSHSALDTSVSVLVNDDENVKNAHLSFNEKYEQLGADPEFATLSDIVDAPWVNRSAAIGVEGAGDAVKIDENFKGILLQTEKGSKLLTFAHESNNTRTSVDPVEGASACLGESMRKLVRLYATPYDCMRISGIGSPYVREGEDNKGATVQRALAREACDSFASYARAVGVPCSLNSEYVNDSFNSRHMEVSAVLASLDVDTLVEKQAAERTVSAGDMILVIGKRTGRDGRVYSRYLKHISDRLAEEANRNENEPYPDFLGDDSESNSSIRQRAEIVKRESYAISRGVKLYGEAVSGGDAIIQRKLMRLCEDPEFRGKIKKIRDVDSSGIVTAASTLAGGVAIYLDCVPVKYNGMSSTEVAFSETCERMVVAVDKDEAANVIAICARMGLVCACIGTVTDDRHLSVYGGGSRIAFLSSEFLKDSEAGRRLEASVDAPGELEDAAALAVALRPIDETKPIQRLFSKPEPDHIGAYSNIAINSKIKTRARKRRFDCNVCGTSVFSPMGDRLAMASVSYILDGDDILTRDGKKLCSAVTLGMHPDICDVDPFKGAYYAVTDAIARLVSSGGSVNSMHIATHLFHPTYRSDSAQTGDTLASVLGIYDAQEKLGVNSICGDFSMGGLEGSSTKPAVAIFGIGTGTAENFHSSEFKQAGNKLIVFKPEMAKNGLPVPQSQIELFEKVEGLFAEGRAVSAISLTNISLAEGVMYMCFGSLGLGFEFDKDCTPEELYGTLYGAMAVELKDGEEIPKGAIPFGVVTDRYEIEIKGRGGKHTVAYTEEDSAVGSVSENGDITISVDSLMELCYSEAKGVYETDPFFKVEERLKRDAVPDFACSEDPIADHDREVKRESYLLAQAERIMSGGDKSKKTPEKFAQMSFDSYTAVKKKIQIVVPVFGGSVGEGMIIRSLEACCLGSNVEVVPVACLPDKASLDDLAAKISNAGMLCLPDSTDSPAVIAAMLKNSDIAKAIVALRRSCGLIYGCGAGFSALLRSGLVGNDPFDTAASKKITVLNEASSLAISDIPLSGLIRKQTLVRASSVNSPFMSKAEQGGVYRTEISTYCGRLVGDTKILTAMGENGVITTQYCDTDGGATMDQRYNPCASILGVDSIISADGNIMGQISLPTRAQCCSDSYLNHFGSLPVFESAVAYLGE